MEPTKQGIELNMLELKFKNLEKSELAREVVAEKVGLLLEKSAELKKSKVVITLELQNSADKPEPDLFSVKLQIINGKYAGTTLSESSPNMYNALSDLAERLVKKIDR